MPSPERRYVSLANAAKYAECNETTLRRHIAAVPVYRPLYRPFPTSLVPSSKPVCCDAREVASYLSTGGETTSEPSAAVEGHVVAA